MAGKKQTEIVFWSKVDKSGGPDACWPWTNAKNKQGYGVTSFGKRFTYCHRAAYTFSKGPIPHGLFTCHKCDNPPCCNPAHLFIATPAENSADRDSKERQARGEKNIKAKLRECDVIAIRAAYRPGVYGFGSHVLAKRFGVTAITVRRIINGVSWTHI